MIGPNEELKSALISAIPKDTDDPKFYEKMAVVNEVMVELAILMQEQYKKDIAKLTVERDAWKESSYMYADLYVKESEWHNKTRAQLGVVTKALRGTGATVEFVADKEEVEKLTLERDDAIAAANIRAKEHRDARDRAAVLEQDLWNCRAARDAYSTQVDAYRKWEQRISKG